MYNGQWHNNIKIGDHNVLNQYLDYNDGDIDKLHSPSICVFSLTGKFEPTNKYYKMLAQLF